MKELITRLSDQDLAIITGGVRPPDTKMVPGGRKAVKKLLEAAGVGAAWEVGSRAASKALDFTAKAVANTQANKGAVTVHHHVPGCNYGPTFKGPTQSCIK